MADSLIELIEGSIEAELPLALHDLGGYRRVATNSDAIALSRFAPEILSLVWQHRGHDEALAHTFLVELLDKASHDITFAGLVDVLLTADAVPDALVDHCSHLLVNRFRDTAQPLLVRTSALRGALSLVRGAARRRASLKSALLWLSKSDDTFFLAHAVRVAGLMASETGDDDLLRLLVELRDNDALRADAAFEIGMIHVGQAIAEVAKPPSGRLLALARDQFALAEETGASRPDATLLKQATSLLIALREGFLPLDISERIRAVQLAAFACQAYLDAPDEVIGLPTRGYELACWSSLAVRLAHWLNSTAEPAWYEATLIIEQELLSLYDANRTLFGRAPSGAFDTLIQPQLVASLSGNRAQLHLLRRWLAHNPAHPLSQVAQELIARADAILLATPATDFHPALAEAEALHGRTPLSHDLLADVIGATVAISARRTSPKITEYLQQARTTFSALDDYRLNQPARQLFDALILQVLRFLESRLDDSSHADPSIEYLFKTEAHELPIEKHLQHDYLRFLRASGLGEVNELDCVGGGRSDVVVMHEGVRIVTELKRELSNVTWSNLLASYGQQTATYQTTNVRLGALLVLDLVPRHGTTPHIDTLCHCAVDNVFGDGPRGIFVARVPGRRLKPHELNR